MAFAPRLGTMNRGGARNPQSVIRNPQSGTEKFLAQILQMISGLRGFAGSLAHQLFGFVALTMLVDFLAQPPEQAVIVAGVQFTGKGWQVEAGAAHELGGVQIAERVGREITKRAETPVSVLQTATGVVRHFQAEHFLKLPVP